LRYNPTLPSLGPEFDFRPAHFLFRFTTAPLWVWDCGYDSYSIRAICVVVKSNITVVGPRVRFPVHLVFQDNSWTATSSCIKSGCSFVDLLIQDAHSYILSGMIWYFSLTYGCQCRIRCVSTQTIVLHAILRRKPSRAALW
jgi:hypothetical protein